MCRLYLLFFCLVCSIATADQQIEIGRNESPSSLGTPVGSAKMAVDTDIARPSRTLVAGTIGKITLSADTSRSGLVGRLELIRGDGEVFPFDVFELTLILVRDAFGKLRVARFAQLKPGWKCEVAYDLPTDDDDDDMDLLHEQPVLQADNMIVDLPKAPIDTMNGESTISK